MHENYAKYEELLQKVEKPARYSGGEYNSRTDFSKGKARFCLCFPDLYEVAISNLGNKIIYNYLNSLDEYSCERCYCPWSDMAKELRESGLPLFSLDTRTPLNEFDGLGFSLSYEMCYTNMLEMLALSNIPLKSKDRTEKDPLIFAGGVCTVNPEPYSDFVDFVIIGEGEVNLTPVMDVLAKYRNGLSREEALKEIDELYFAYVPSCHNEIRIDGKYAGLENEPYARKAIVEDFNECYFPTDQIVPNIQAVHDRAVLEIFRGCPRGCRFCQAGFGYRPIRGRTPEKLIELTKKLIDETGFDEISLNSLSTGDFPCIEETIRGISKVAKERGVKLSLPSLRLDSFAGEKTDGLKKTGSLTFAPEAGSQRLRNVINKDISEEDFENAMKEAFQAGYRSVKLYFMIGLPTETDEDIKGIFEMCKKVKEIYRSVTGRRDVTVSASCANFVPKPFTPFERRPQDSAEELDRKHELLRDIFYKSGFKLSYHDTFTSKLEGTFALGGREMNDVLYNAYNLGATFDGWTEKFNKDAWKKAFEISGIDIEKETDGYEKADVLPWQFIDVGVSRKFFEKEDELAEKGIATGGCGEKCLGCGATKLGECKKCF